MKYFILGFITVIVVFILFQMFLYGSDVEEELLENYERKK